VVQFLIKRDKHDTFRFAALQSEVGQRLIDERNIDAANIDSIVFIEPGMAYYTKAAAALRIGQALGGGYRLLWLFEWIPKGISNLIYDFIARNRYQWYGKKDACMIPTPELKAKFLD